ncbi:MAG: hypothetical protein LBM28_06560 [Oscillospiraceae bacterium]|jgi:hypothetical protein|nr:hypothetical protein [Oscillospiraceae bacterium]
MKIPKNLFLLILVTAMILSIFSGCGESKKLTVMLENNLGYDIEELYINVSNAKDWGELRNSGKILRDGSKISLTLSDSSAAGEYDLYAVDTDGDSYTFFDLPLTDGAKIALVAGSDSCEAVITPKKGDSITIPGSFAYGESLEPTEPAPIPLPDKTDELSQSVVVAGSNPELTVYYPSSMKVLENEDQVVTLDAVNDVDELYTNIYINVVDLNNYDDNFAAGETMAKTTLDAMADQLFENSFGDLLIQIIGAEFENGGDYYGATYYTWLSGAYFEENPGVPVRGVMQIRYYGPGKQLVVAHCAAHENRIQTYFEIARNMLDALDYGGDWSTAVPDSGNSGGGNYYNWSDPGDSDYDPWSDPGDWDYDPWSDPGDSDYDPWSDPGDGDYGDQGYDY